MPHVAGAGDRATGHRGFRRFVLDVSPLVVSPSYRRLFAGVAGLQFARQLLVVAVPYEIYVTTGSTLLVGMAGLVQVGPLILFALVGGVLSDAKDRRRILIAVESTLVVVALGYAINSANPSVGISFALLAVNAALTGLEGPALVSMIPSLVPSAKLASAFALHQSISQLMQVLGPALAGVVISTSGLRTAYILAAVTSFAAVLAVMSVKLPKVQRVAMFRVGALRDGWRYLRRAPLLQQLMLIDLGAMTFGMPRAVFPAFGTDVLNGDAVTVGLLFAAPGAGALIGALTTGWVADVTHQGRAVIVGAVAFGAAVALFGLSSNLVLCLVLLALAGFFDVISNIFRNTILQLSVPDEMRGRMSSFKNALSGAGPRLGDAQVGTVAAVTTPGIAVVGGGLTAVAVALLIGFCKRELRDQQFIPPPGEQEEGR